MQMSSAEIPGKEKRGLTLIPCSVWRARSPDVRYWDVLHAAAVEVSVQGMSLQLALHLQQISFDAHPLKPNKALYQAQSPRTSSSNAWHSKPPSCDHEQPALCRCPATAPGRAAPMATTPPEGTSCSSRRCPQWHPACTCLHTCTRRSIPVFVVSYRHSAFPTLASNGVSVALVLLCVGTATVPKLTTRPSPPNRTLSVRRCGSPARSRRSTPQLCASGVRRRLRGDPRPASSRHRCRGWRKSCASYSKAAVELL